MTLCKIIEDIFKEENEINSVNKSWNCYDSLQMNLPVQIVSVKLVFNHSVYIN